MGKMFTNLLFYFCVCNIFPQILDFTQLPVSVIFPEKQIGIQFSYTG